MDLFLGIVVALVMTFIIIIVMCLHCSWWVSGTNNPPQFKFPPRAKKSTCERCGKEFEQVYREEYNAHTSFKYCKECRVNLKIKKWKVEMS